MKLYGSLASPYVGRVVLFARLKGLALEPQMPEGGIKSAEYLAKNPMGKMPVLELDGVAIPESEVICELLEDLHPGTGGLPVGLPRSATLGSSRMPGRASRGASAISNTSLPPRRSLPAVRCHSPTARSNSSIRRLHDDPEPVGRTPCLDGYRQAPGLARPQAKPLPVLADDLPAGDILARIGAHQHEQILVVGLFGGHAERRRAAAGAAGPVEIRDAGLRLTLSAGRKQENCQSRECDPLDQRAASRLIRISG